MKKVLITGSAGAIGESVLKYLLSEGKYEITAVDLPNNKTYKKLKKYKKRCNIVFADLTNPVITDGLVKDQDFIIHLASITPNMARLKKELCELIDYRVTENIVRAITFYNPSCHLLFASVTTMYKIADKVVSSSDKETISRDDYYSKCKLKSEELIKRDLKNYVIYRLPMILTNPSNNYFVYNGIKDEEIEVITDLDASYAFVKSLDNITKLNKKTFNLGGGSSCIIKYKDLINKVLLTYGLSFKYIFNMIFINKDYHGHIYEDKVNLNDILNYRNDSIDSFIMRLKRQSKKRIVQKFLAMLIIRKGNSKK